MDLQIQIETGENCLFKIIDNTTYVPYESIEIPLDQLKYLDSETIVILALYDSTKEDVIYKDPYYIKHDKDQYNEIIIPTKFDGLFNFSFIVLPNKTYAENLINQNTYTYYVDNNKVFKTKGDLTLEVDAKELAELDLYKTNILRVSDTLVSICSLKTIFRDICKKIYDLKIKSCSIKGGQCSAYIYNRDLLWHYINMISYYTDMGDFYEAQRLIEIITKCYINEIKIKYGDYKKSGCSC